MVLIDKKRIFISIIVLIMALGLYGCSENNAVKVPDDVYKFRQEFTFDNIKSARIELANSGIVLYKYVFDLKDIKQSKKLKDIVKHLGSDKYQGYAEEKIKRKGGSPDQLIIELSDGTTVQIKDAVGEKFSYSSNFSMQMQQFDIPNEVTVSVSADIINNGSANSGSANTGVKPFRLESSEIRKLIDGGYKDVFK